MVFADRYRDAPTTSQRVLVWLDATGGVLREAPREHAQVIAQDLRFPARVLLRTPGFFVSALLTLALGIGATTAIFQLIDAVGLRTLPVPAPHELAEIRIVGGNRGFGLNPDKPPRTGSAIFSGSWLRRFGRFPASTTPRSRRTSRCSAAAGRTAST